MGRVIVLRHVLLLSCEHFVSSCFFSAGVIFWLVTLQLSATVRGQREIDAAATDGCQYEGYPSQEGCFLGLMMKIGRRQLLGNR
jgi:hypothetical protein